MKPLLLVALLAGIALPAAANDTAAELGVGGLVFVVRDDIEMAREDLFISRNEVRVRYEFVNTDDADQRVLVAFPMPDIEADHWSPVALPTENADNIFDFSTMVNGVPVEAELHQYAFAVGIDRTALLRGYGLPLMPSSEAAREAMAGLSDEAHRELFRLGLAVPESYDAGQGWVETYLPFWTLKATYSFEAVFPAGRTVVVEHRYKPSVGGTAGVAFLSGPSEGYDPLADYTRKYCLEDSFVNAVKRTMTPGEPWTAPFTESWISYILTTGANWGGPIKDFRLTIDKGAAQNLVSFCGEGVTKTGPTTFEMRKTDFYPDTDLHILVLERTEPGR
jgi:hypothetical protein